MFVHGNLSTGRFYEHLMPGAPERLRLIAPDIRGFGDTEHVPIDATRGLADWADDVDALLRALGVSRPVHLAGWSTGGAAIASYAGATPGRLAHVHRPGLALRLRWRAARRHPCHPDYAGSGGGTAPAGAWRSRCPGSGWSEVFSVEG